MGEVTDLVVGYRECARQVWNNFVKDLPDGWHEFIGIENELFSGLVLAQTDEAKDWNAEFSEHGYYTSLAVEPQLGPRGIEAMWAREKKKNNWHWHVVQITEPDIQLGYMNFFDWDERGYRDYQYIRSRVVASAAHHDLVGADLLLPALWVKVHYKKAADDE